MNLVKTKKEKSFETLGDFLPVIGCLSGGTGNRLPVQTEMSELKSVNCGEALTSEVEGNPQPSSKEISGRFRDYNHSVQTGEAVDDGIVQPTTASDSGSGKPGVGTRRAGFKIPYLYGCAGSIPAGGTIFYRLRFENVDPAYGTEKNLVGIVGGWLSIYYKHHQGLGDRVKSGKIFESDLFFLNQFIPKIHAVKSHHIFRFERVS